MKLVNTPKTMDLHITNRCNLRCTYCSFFSGPGDTGSDLPAEEWLEFFDELRRCAVMSVTFEGGEPLIREDLKDLIDGVVRNRMRFSILSNGTLITDEMAAFIASTGRCDNVQVSIDGSTSETHDACRGEGNFDKALEGIKKLREHKINTAVRVTIHRHNVYDLDQIAKVILEDIGIPDFTTNYASHLGMCRQNANSVQLTLEELVYAMETLVKLKNKYKGRISGLAGPLANAERWTWMEQARERDSGLSPNKESGALTGCNGIFSQLAVRSDGIMIPCVQMAHIELGRINSDDLKAVWLKHPELDRLRKRKSIPLDTFEFCRDCDYIPYCTGNCPAISYNYTGMEDHPSPDACLKRFLEAGGRLPHDA